MAATHLHCFMHIGRHLCALMILATATLAAAQDVGDARFETVEGRKMLILPTSTGEAGLRTRSASGNIAAQSFESSSHRTHVVYVEGAEYRVTTPLQGPGAWVAFDPARRRFESLLPSIRVELAAGEQLDAVVKAVDATGVEAFDSLGFAVLYLPSNLHPADAVTRTRELPGQPDAFMRLRRSRVKWR